MTRYLVILDRKLFFWLIISLLPISSLTQSLTGTIIDGEDKSPLIGACLEVESSGKGSCTDADGVFLLPDCPSPPFSIKVTYLGYTTLNLQVKVINRPLNIVLEKENINLDVVEIRAENSAIQRNVSLTVESVGLEEIQSTSESSFYDVLANMRETDMMTVSFGVKVINARGFNSSTPIRSLQLIDGIDNASPGLNYPLGNFMGLPELDVVGVDLVIGASSAYFGPGAFNGVINMRTKSPFNHQGLEAQVKVGERNYLETSVRYAHVFRNKLGNDKLGVKFNISYSKVYDWEAEDGSPSLSSLKDSIFSDNPGGFDAVNKYGDEVSADFSSLFEQYRHPGLGKFFRTGYWEKDLADYTSHNLKTSGAIHYLLTPKLEFIGSTNYGSGTTVIQLDNRLSLKNVWAMQNRLELRMKDKFFVRFYTTREDAGDTYDIVSTAYIIQGRGTGDNAWLNNYKSYWFRNINSKVRELPGFPELGPPPDYYYDFDQARLILGENASQILQWHQETRNSVDGSFIEPGSDIFMENFNQITSTKVSEGGTKYIDKSKLYHWNAEYKFKTKWLDEITVGGAYRLYTPYSEGTIFADTSGTVIRTYEYGIYTGVEKLLANDRLKLNLAVRMDKHENYNYLISPALSLQYILNPTQSLRLSVSSALRNPTLIEQYYYFKVGQAILLGNIQGYENLIDLDSFEDYLDNNLNQSLLVYFDEPPIKPEEAIATELAYSGLFLNEKLDLKSTIYFNRYQDFIGYKLGLKIPFYRGFPGIPVIYRFAANAEDVTFTAGFSTGLTYYVNNFFNVSGNYSWNKIFQKSDDPLIPAYNTPEHKFNLGVNGSGLSIGKTKYWSFGTSFRWVESYTFESSPQFSGTIPAQIHINGQISKGFPKLGSTLKLSGSNLLNRKQNGLYGGPKVGRFVFLSWYFQLK